MQPFSLPELHATNSETAMPETPPKENISSCRLAPLKAPQPRMPKKGEAPATDPSLSHRPDENTVDETNVVASEPPPYLDKASDGANVVSPPLPSYTLDANSNANAPDESTVELRPQNNTKTVFILKPVPSPKNITSLVTKGDFPIFGQSRYSYIDVFNRHPLEYFDSKSQAPLEIFHKTTPPVDIHLSGDGFPHPLVPHSFSIVDHTNFDWDVLIRRSSLFFLSNFSPFEDTAPFPSHKSYVNNITSTLHSSPKKGVLTNVYVLYCARTSAADPHMLNVLDRRIDLLALKPWVNQTVVCPQQFPTMCDKKKSKELESAALALEHPMVLLQLCSGLALGVGSV